MNAIALCCDLDFGRSLTKYFTDFQTHRAPTLRPYHREDGNHQLNRSKNKTNKNKQIGLARAVLLPCERSVKGSQI